ncbi:MAG: FeoB-associated Cys-rich membrane protein [Peptococcaceae bacterium]|nr:FeoB-associated Cys-rich membrane protein [Peptococcaceae bacterium]
MSTWIIAILVFGGLACAGRSIYNSRKNGSSCGQGCDGCGGCGGGQPQSRQSQPEPRD